MYAETVQDQQIPYATIVHTQLSLVSTKILLVPTKIKVLQQLCSRCTYFLRLRESSVFSV